MFKKPVIMAVFFVVMTISYVASAVQPYFYKLFMDAISNGNLSILTNILLAYIGTKFVAMAFFMTGRSFGDRAMLHALPLIDVVVFKRLQDLDFAFHTNKSSGALINRMKRGQGALWGLHEVLDYKFVNFIVNAIVLFFFFRMLDLWIVLLALASVVLAFIAASIAIPRNISARKNMNKIGDKVTGVIVDNLVNYDTVKMFAKENWELKRLKRMYVSWKKYLWRYAMSFRYIGGSTWTITNFALFFILLLLIGKQDNLSPGEFILVVGFLHQLDSSASELIWNIRDLPNFLQERIRLFLLELNQDLLIH